MGLPLHTRAAALVAALSTTAAIIVTMAEIGHPPPDGYGLLSLLQVPDRGSPQLLAPVKPEPVQGPVALEMPQP